MKIRTGFVSNSSSSSFVCMVTGEIESGYDVSLSDFEMYRCCNEHTFGDKFLIRDVDFGTVRAGLLRDCHDYPAQWDPTKQTSRNDQHRAWLINRFEEAQQEAVKRIQWIEQYDSTDAEQLVRDFVEQHSDEGSFRYAVPSVLCPICSLQHIQDEDLVDFLLATANTTREQTVQQIQKQCSSLKDLHLFIQDLRNRNATPGRPPGFTIGGI